MKRTISLILATALLALVACGNTDNDKKTGVTDDGTPTSSQDTETERLYPDVSGINYGGEEFNIIQFDAGPDKGYSAGFYFALDPESETGDILKDSVYRRNTKIEDTIGIKLNYVGYDNGGELMKAFRQSVLAADGSYDLVVPFLYYYPTMITEDLVVDMTGIDSLDLSLPWYDQKSVQELSILGHVWGVVSDFTIADKMSSMCVFFSKHLVEDYGLEDPYELVLDGKWTFDYMTEKARLVESDLNGNQMRDLEDRYGIMSDVDFSYEMLHAGGYKIAEKNSDDIPEFTVYGEKEISALQKIYAVMNETMFLNRKSDNALTMPKMAQIFANDQVLYFQHIPEALLELRQSTNDFGIIPLPKFTADQTDYITPITHYAATFTSIPKTAKDIERSATVLNLLAAESSYEVMPELYDTVLGVKYVRDDSSSKMLDIIFDNRTYDIGNICNYGDVAYNVHIVYYKTPDSFVSKLESKKSSAEKALEKMIEQIRENER